MMRPLLSGAACPPHPFRRHSSSSVRSGADLSHLPEERTTRNGCRASQPRDKLAPTCGMMAGRLDRNASACGLILIRCGEEIARRNPSGAGNSRRTLSISQERIETSRLPGLGAGAGSQDVSGLRVRNRLWGAECRCILG